ncbi:MAG: gamma-glutamyltransferase, partial [Bdellovibrionales bacterium]|nr:gamma-glutamyltransferase [Bdellovibrionales bacterium]
MRKIYAFFILSAFAFSCSFTKPVPKGPTASYPKATKYAEASNYIIATQGDHASKAAKKMFDLGGNAIDAAVAASYVISVERQQSTGLGGGGFMLIHFAKTKETVAVDFREVAPLASFEKMFQDGKGNVVRGRSREGIYAVGVPGLVAGLIDVHEKYGTLSRDLVMQPAIDVAENGFTLYSHFADAIERKKEYLQKSEYAKSIFFRENGTPKQVGDVLIQKDLAKVLKEIQKNGRDGFYKGWVSQSIVSESRRRRGLLTQKDFDLYKVSYREPIQGEYHGYQIFSMPPPSSGGVHVVQILNLLKSFDIKKHGPYSPYSIHHTSAAMQIAFADRAKLLGDSDFVDVPVEALLSQSYAQQSAKSIGSMTARVSDPSDGGQLKEGSNETTHFSIMDREGNVVASTQTINFGLGAGIVVPGTGIVLNNEMDDFTAKPGEPNGFGAIGGVPNAIVAGKRPLSSMTPTLVLQEGKPVLALGSPNGTRIISCVLLTMLNHLEYGMNLWDAVSALRYHHQWFPDEIRVEDPGFSPKLTKSLESIGYRVNQNSYDCRVQAVGQKGDR